MSNQRPSAKAAQQIARFEPHIVQGPFGPYAAATADPNGNLVTYTEHCVEVEALQSRVAELGAALRECAYAVISGGGNVPPSVHQALSTEGEPHERC